MTTDCSIVWHEDRDLAGNVGEKMENILAKHYYSTSSVNYIVCNNLLFSKTHQQPTGVSTRLAPPCVPGTSAVPSTRFANTQNTNIPGRLKSDDARLLVFLLQQARKEYPTLKL